jgi:hypothetical protein
MKVTAVTPIYRSVWKEQRMPRNLNIIKPVQMVDVTCVDHDTVAQATVISHTVEKLVVELPKGIRLVMNRHPRLKNVYVGSFGGLTFETKV